MEKVYAAAAAAAAKLLQSCPTLCDPRDGTHQAPPSLGFSRQEHWSGLLFPSPVHESEDAQSYPTHSDSMDCSLPGSFIHGIFQARVLEWGAIAFSGRSSIPSAETRTESDCGSDHELLIAKFRLKLKKVGKTTRPFRYDLNQIP